MNDIILNNPSLTPVWSDNSVLFSGRRCPDGCRLCNLKALYRNIIQPCPVREKAAFSHINFNACFIGIGSVKICINGCLFIRNLCIPAVKRIFRTYQFLFPPAPCLMDTLLPLLRMKYLVQRIRLKKRLTIQINITGVNLLFSGAYHPVTIDFRGKWIVIPKNSIINFCFPHSSFHKLPVIHLFGTFYHHMLSLCCHICNSAVRRKASVSRLYPLTVHAFMDNHRISCDRHICCPLNRKKWTIFCSRISIGTGFCNIINCSHTHFLSFSFRISF